MGGGGRDYKWGYEPSCKHLLKPGASKHTIRFERPRGPLATLVLTLSNPFGKVPCAGDRGCRRHRPRPQRPQRSPGLPGAFEGLGGRVWGGWDLELQGASVKYQAPFKEALKGFL